MAKDRLEVLMRYLTRYGEVIDRRAANKPQGQPDNDKEESAQLLRLAITWSHDPENEDLRTAVLRSALRLAHIKGDNPH